jgi:signal transduction histidine kinase/DNA-binding response OmpR family regulator
MTPTPRPEVLIVDDQPRNLDALESMLSTLDCVFVRAETADQALLSLLRHDFAAIILDIQMPGMSGIDLAKLIKQRKRSQHVPILFLTAHLIDETDVMLGYDVGGVDYLSKPINPNILRSKVSAFIELFRKTRALSLLNDALQREVAERERAQQALEHVNADLERRVQERTAALTRAHQGVRENEERLRMAMDVGRIGAWEWQLPTGQMTWSADPAVLFNFPPGSLGEDQRLFRRLHEEDKPRVEAAVARALESGSYEVEYRAVRPDGTVVWIAERSRIVRDDDGLVTRLVGVSRDITAEREAERERERLLHEARAARDEAERESRLKDEFLATLSHELRTPMNAVLGWLAILESGKPIRDIHAALAVIRRNSELQARLIDDLLDMNRLLSGNFTMEIGDVDIASMLQTAMQALGPTADARRVKLIAAVDGGGAIRADARRLQQVFWNLLHNAVKFTPNGGRVELRLQRGPGMVQISVADNGRGISSGFLPHVFDRFRQQDASPTRESSGLGLGLSIAKHLVEMHGGTIEAFSAGVGQGARFVVTLPEHRQESSSGEGGAGMPHAASS